MATWWREAERLWLENRSSARHTLRERLDYRRGLVNQFPAPQHRVVYTKGGMYLAAARVDDPRAVIDHKLYWAVAASLDEGRYLVAILNAEETTQRVRPLQASTIDALAGSYTYCVNDRVTKPPVVSRLLPGDRAVALSPGWAISGEEAASALIGLTRALNRHITRPVLRPATNVTDLDRRAARSPEWARRGIDGITGAKIVLASLAAWDQRTLAEERDRRLAGRDDLSDPTSRSRAAGRVTRELIAELADRIQEQRRAR